MNVAENRLRKQGVGKYGLQVLTAPMPAKGNRANRVAVRGQAQNDIGRSAIAEHASRPLNTHAVWSDSP
jgi:hypothetical protein